MNEEIKTMMKMIYLTHLENIQLLETSGADSETIRKFVLMEKEILKDCDLDTDFVMKAYND